MLHCQNLEVKIQPSNFINKCLIQSFNKNVYGSYESDPNTYCNHFHQKYVQLNIG